ncbi:MAG: MnmC family methyltransferase, partial [Planctomycetota bacterium]
MPIQPARIQFDPQGNAFSETYDDIYFNPDHAEGKTNHLFHRATRFDDQLDALAEGQPLIVGELGFGLALNFLGTWTKFKRLAPPNCRLHYVGLDVAPPSAEQLRQALGPFDDWADETQQLLREWPGRVAGVHRLRLDRCDLTLHLGDIDDTLDGVRAQADVWFL